MTIGQLELPLFPLTGEPCKHFSVSQRCRYHAGHRGDHTFGGGMGDPVQLRRCAIPAEHPAHAWPDGLTACSGRSA
jgi:hypothetical protein